MQTQKKNHQVCVIMGSQSDWSTMTHTAQMLTKLAISYDVKIISAHRTPDRLFKFASEAKNSGYNIIIAGAGGAAHLPGMIAAKTSLPVIGVPVKSSNLNGLDSLLSIVQMPAGVPVATVAIGKAGATNAAILAASILSISDSNIAKSLEKFRENQTEQVALTPHQEQLEIKELSTD